MSAVPTALGTTTKFLPRTAVLGFTIASLRDWLFYARKSSFMKNKRGFDSNRVPSLRDSELILHVHPGLPSWALLCRPCRDWFSRLKTRFTRSRFCGVASEMGGPHRASRPTAACRRWRPTSYWPWCRPAWRAVPAGPARLSCWAPAPQCRRSECRWS